MTSSPHVTDSPTSCFECDCDIPTGCVVIRRVERVKLERQRILSHGPASVIVNGRSYGGTCTVAQTYEQDAFAESLVCLDCAEPAEAATVAGVLIVGPEDVGMFDASPEYVEAIVLPALPSLPLPKLLPAAPKDR